eukprot:scaffold47770_cov98-Phaeocystis_antarctica.AAC.1
MFNICRTTIAFRLTCDPQLPCVHRDCIIALQLGLAAKRSLYRLALRLSVLSTLRPTYRPRCAARQYASIIAIAPRSAYVVGRISIVFKLPCYLQLLCVHSDCQ